MDFCVSGLQVYHTELLKQPFLSALTAGHYCRDVQTGARNKGRNDALSFLPLFLDVIS